MWLNEREATWPYGNGMKRTVYLDQQGEPYFVIVEPCGSGPAGSKMEPARKWQGTFLFAILLLLLAAVAMTIAA